MEGELMDAELQKQVSMLMDKLVRDVLDRSGVHEFGADVCTFGSAAIRILNDNGITFCRVPLTLAETIARNQILTAPQMPGDDSILETRDGAGDTFDNIGPPVVIAPYKPPRDKRVRQLLKDGAAARKAEEALPREIFRDPRLDPNYRPPRPSKK